MVAVVAGNGLGLFNTSLNTLGGQGVLGQGGFGQAGGQTWVNAASGNLILQFTDKQLSGQGLDLFHQRTYNALGDDEGAWRWDGERRVTLNGSLNVAGSSVVRTTGDGHETRYLWNGSLCLYQSSDGEGAHDSLKWDATASEWVWTDGSRRTEERYNGTSGLLRQVKDATGTLIEYGYTSIGAEEKLTSVKDASDQELVLVYNDGGQLVRLDTRNYADWPLARQVYYSYDDKGRLSSVTTDLTPADNSISDGKVYTTTYTYDGVSSRIAGVSQSDGTSVSFTYELVGSEYRIKTVVDSSGTTGFSYNLIERSTQIVDGAGRQWDYRYDESGRLLEVLAPTVGTQRISTRYAYDAEGNVLQITDGRGNTLSYGYDANGNRVLERDAAGNTVKRVFSAANQVLNEIRFSEPATWNAATSTWTEPSSATGEVTRFSYDADNRLRFVLSPLGVVTEYRYNGLGQRISERVFADARYAVSSLANEVVIAESDLNTWAVAQERDLTRTSLTAWAYDTQGNLSQTTRYATVAADGLGVLDAAATRTEWVYSPNGQLKQSLVIRGVDRSTRAVISSYGYDGLGRLLTEADASGSRTYTYNGASRQVIFTNSAGLSVTRTYDTAGRLLSVSEEAASLPATRLTQYRYDAAGRLVMVQDATGVRSYTFYDELGRVSARVDGRGAVTEFRYNETSQKASETRYATRVDTSGWYNGTQVVKTHIDQIRPAPNASEDRKTTFTYDSAGRLIESADALNNSKTYGYDGLGRLIREEDGERVTRTFYDEDGRVAGALDAAGYLRENKYDAAGRLTRVIRYSILTAEASRASGTFAQLRPSATGALSDWYFYDDQGRQIGHVDEQGFVSETVYDDAANKQQSIRYATVYTSPVGIDFAAIRTAVAGGAKQITTTTFDGYGRVSQRQDYAGTITAYTYDAAGRLISEVRAQGAGEARTSLWRYDALGQVLGKLSGEGAARITAGMTDAQVQATYAQYGLTYTFDAAGRQLSVTDPAGNTVLSYFDAAGNLTYTVNKLGEVTETEYNAFGEATKNTRFLDRVSTTGLTGGLLTTPLSVLTQAIRNNAGNSTQRYSFDRRGQLASSTDALGYVTSYGYNGFGEKTSITRTISQGSTPKSTTTWLAYSKRGELLETAEDIGGLSRSTFTEYDAFGRVISRTDGRGLISKTRYDNGGRAVVQTNPLNQSETTEYDAFGRVLKVTDALSRVTSYSYDDASRTLTQTLPDGVTVVTSRNRHGETLSLKDARGNTTSYTYNKDGQLLTSTNALSGVTTNTYDAAGLRLSVKDASGNVIDYTYDALGRTLTATDALDNVSTYDYDGQGRKIRLTEGYGSSAVRVTEYRYDALGQLQSIVQDPAGLKLTTSYVYDGLGRQLEVRQGTLASPAQQVTRYEFDNLGRRVAETVDPDGLKLSTLYEYNDNDQIIKKTQVLDPQTKTGYSTTYAYDNAGRLTSVTDVLGFTESYTYDTVGNRLTLKNKKGHVWTYSYDVRNRLVEEVSPSISAGSIDAAGTVTAKTVRSVTLISYDANGNVLSRSEGILRDPTYPAVADDVSQARTTSYTYDKLNRQITITSPGWYNKATGAFQQAGDGTSNTFQVVTTVTYDAVGNAVRNRVKANNTGTAATDYVDSYKVYDKAGRVTHDIDAMGGVIAYGYDAVGNAISTKRYANALTGSVPARGYYLTADITATNLVGDAAKDRTLTSSFDKAGRKVSVKQDFVTLFTFTGNVSTSTEASLAPTTVYTYDALGRVISETLQGRDANGVVQQTGATTTYYYDKAGNRIGTVDALGYYTKSEYDQLGRLSRQIEYKTALSSWTTSSVPAAPASQADDRITEYDYDAMGRVTQVTRKNVRYWSQDATSFSGVVTSQELRGDIVESTTTYDAVGNALTITDALGNTTTTGYDALGRVIKVTEPARWATKAGAVDPFALGFDGIVLASPVTTYVLNVFGQAIREIRAAGVDANGVAQAGASRTTRTLFDAVGNEIKSIDATSNSETYKVDVAGRRIQELQAVDMTLNGWTWLDGNKFRFQQEIKRNFEYDKLGRQTASIAWYGDWDGLTKAAKESVEYNGFGEITARRMNGELTALYNYNQVGRVESYADMKDWIVGVSYDLAGNATRNTQIGQLWGSADDDRITYTRYDKLGRAIEQHLPSFSANTSADTLNNVALSKVTPIIRQSFDRWGNVLSRTDARGYSTQYGYDHNNRLYSETYAATTVLRENNTSYRASAIKIHQFDAAGRHIADQDKIDPDNTTTSILRTRQKVYNQAGEMEREVDALGNWRTYRVDAFGNRIATRSETGVVTVDTFDQMDRHTSHGIIRNGASVTLLTNRYDQAGRLVAETTGTAEVEETLTATANTSNWNSNASGVAGNTRYTLRDALGNIQWQLNESKVIKLLGYDAYGRKVSERNNLGNSQTWTYSTGDWSRLIKHSDLSGRVFEYGYNLFGELATETYKTNPAPDTENVSVRTYGYYENGLLKSISDVFTSSSYGTEWGDFWNKYTYISEYAYDRSGAKVLERTSGVNDYNFLSVPDLHGSYYASASEVRNQYDELGRLLAIKMPSGSYMTGSPEYSMSSVSTARIDNLAYSYDEFGNKRRIYLDTTSQTGVRTVRDDWYKYDAEGRVLVAEGFVDGTSVVAGKLNGVAKGYTESYNASGQRISQETWNSTVNGQERYIKDSFTYNDLGLMQTQQYSYQYRAAAGDSNDAILSTANMGMVSSLVYDAFGKRTSYSQYTNNTVSKVTHYSYRGDGMLHSQFENKIEGGVEWRAQAVYFNETNMIDAAGNQALYRWVALNKNGSINSRGDYWTVFVGYDSYKELKVTVSSTKSGGAGVTQNYYSDRGELQGIVVKGAKNYTRQLASNREGLVLDSGDGREAVYFSGRQLAEIGSRVDLISQIEPVSQDMFGLTPGNHVVAEGDTLQSIAMQVWGDDALWYLIADANGLSAADLLVVGDSLKIPNVQGATHNDSNDFKPYNPRDVIGDTTPTPRPPKPKKKKKSGGLSSVVMVVVAVVAAVFTAGAALSAMGAAGSFMSIGATAMTAGGVGAATLGGSALAAGVAALGAGAMVGSAASQLSGMAMGVQDKFSWSQVAAAGITGAISGGVGVYANGLTTAQRFVATAATNYPASYVGNKVAGLDASFSWSAMAASVVGSAIGSYVGGYTGNAAKATTLGGFVKGAAGNQFSALTTAAITDKWFGGARPSYGQVATDAFGNTLAGYVVEEMASRGVAQEVRTAMDAAGVAYSVNEHGGLETPSAHTLDAIERLARNGASGSEIAQLLNDEGMRSSILTKAVPLGDGRIAYHHESGAVSYSTLPDSPIVGTIDDLSGGALVLDPMLVSAVTGPSEDNAFVQTVNTVIPPIHDAQVALGAFAEQHPIGSRIVGFGAQAVMYAAMGPAAAVKDIIFDNTLGPYIEQGQTYAESRLSEFYQGKGVRSDAAPMAASATFFGVSMVLGRVSEGIFAATHAYRRANVPNSAAARRVEVSNGYSYQFDEAGRIDLIEADLVRNPAQSRNVAAQRNAGGQDRLPDDQGGHYIGRRFNGPLEDFNHFAQNGNFNMGPYKALENSWDTALKQGSSVRVQIKPSYLGDSLRPDTLHVQYWIDDVSDEVFFYNREGGR